MLLALGILYPVFNKLQALFCQSWEPGDQKSKQLKSSSREKGGQLSEAAEGDRLTHRDSAEGFL